MKSFLSPEIQSQWHPIKNGDLSPSVVSSGSHKEVWWVCDKSHSYQASVSSRTRGRGCPYCSGNKVLAGFNDALTANPALVNEWLANKNNTDLNKLTAGSGYRAWWVCDKGHEWEALVKDRVNGRGCPFCANKKVLIGFNDLATTNPILASQWHPIKNGELTPQQVAEGWTKKVWWICEKGHEWEQKIVDRSANRTLRCAVCTLLKLSPGVNDLTITHPQLVLQWHPIKNATRATEVTAVSRQKVWWLCQEGHEWETQIYLRASNKTKYDCPVCANKKVLIGFNDLATTHPQLLNEWHATKNADKKPKHFTRGADVRVWWQCSKGHEWETYIYARTASNPSGCPHCSYNVSQAEIEIANFLNEKNVKVITSSRRVISPYELDIYIPDKKIAIEFNGLYWHSEAAGKDQTYHYNKWLKAKNLGIQLIQIWEDDWKRNPDLIKNMLAHKINFSEASKIMGRQTEVVSINKAEAESFLKTNHIQGYASGTYYLGLKPKDGKDIVAVLVIKNEAGTKARTLNIIRYATSAKVVGGFTKLLKYAEKTYKPDAFVTFSDNTVSDGGLYRDNGFIVAKELPPDYMYIINGERQHKFGYRLKRFQNDPILLWEAELTEKELAALNNLPRIWDAGKIKWIKECS